MGLEGKADVKREGKEAGDVSQAQEESQVRPVEINDNDQDEDVVV